MFLFFSKQVIDYLHKYNTIENSNLIFTGDLPLEDAMKASIKTENEILELVSTI